jgi:stage II sporulation protein D
MRRFASLVTFSAAAAEARGLRLMRRSLLLASLLVLVAGAAAPADGRRTTSPGPTGATFVFTGHGWGHGVGMSQYGAYGYAQHGFGYAKIVAHYFPGTELGAAPVTRVRVLLASGMAKLKIGSTDDFTVRDSAGETHDVAAGMYTLTPALKLRLLGQDKATALPGPVTFLPGPSPLALTRRYRGSIQVDVTNGKLRAINVVGLEQYLYGVVPSEMPFSWHSEALKAQAVVARSYALAVRKTGPFDLYPDTRSQVYLGLDHERPATSAAVDATAGKVVLYDGQVAKTYFFSSSGGRTASSQDVWGTAVPYLVSVPDPYDSISPYHDWGPFAFTGAKLGRVLRAPGRLIDIQPELNSSGRVSSLTVVGTNGSVAVAAGNLRRRLGLRSTWFSVGVLSLTAPPATVVYGSSTRLSGLARGLGEVSLQQRSTSGWQDVARVAATKDGRVNLRIKPTATTQYRLASGKVAAAAVRVPVAPLVRLYPPRTQDELRGYMRPILPGSPASIQRQTGTSWTTVARATIADSGTFAAKLRLVDGTYRARVAPGHGFVAGTTPILQVSSS